jgi:hypothetical protein
MTNIAVKHDNVEPRYRHEDYRWDKKSEKDPMKNSDNSVFVDC